MSYDMPLNVILVIFKKFYKLNLFLLPFFHFKFKFNILLLFDLTTNRDHCEDKQVHFNLKQFFNSKVAISDFV